MTLRRILNLLRAMDASGIRLADGSLASIDFYEDVARDMGTLDKIVRDCELTVVW